MSIVMPLMGLPGAGKTTIANALAQRLPWQVVSRDKVREAMFPEVAYSVEEKQAAFGAICAAARVLADRGSNVIVDGMTFSREGELESLAAAVLEHRLCPIFCRVPVEIAIARVETDQRGSNHSALDRNAQLVTRVARSFREIPDEVAIVKTDAPLSTVVYEIEALLTGGYSWHSESLDYPQR